MSKKQMQLEVFEYLEIRCNKNNSNPLGVIKLIDF
jgi:hypothetical protein